jgi:hypothetical protein
MMWFKPTSRLLSQRCQRRVQPWQRDTDNHQPFGRVAAGAAGIKAKLFMDRHGQAMSGHSLADISAAKPHLI